MKVAFAYVTDEQGFELTAYSAMSVALSQRLAPDIVVFCHECAPSRAAVSASFAARGVRLVLLPIGDAGLEAHETCLHVTKPSLLKLLAVERLIDQYDRVVYLDSDMLVFDDLGVAGLDFASSPIAAVVDMDPSENGALRRGSDRAVGEYFNAGLMIFDRRNWSADVMARYAAELHLHDVDCRYKVDCTSIEQCALNAVFEDWAKLPVDYNMQAGAKFTSFWSRARVRHYCGSRKFIPISPFRNDQRDVRTLSEIRTALGLPRLRFSLVYELLFRLNKTRKGRSDRPIRELLHSFWMGGSAVDHQS